MKHQIQLVILLLFYSNIFGQKIHVITQGIESDSSFYHIEKINENEFWAAGEYGILKKIDSLGNVSSQSFPNEGLNILKIIKKENYIFLITDNALIYRYDILNKIFINKYTITKTTTPTIKCSLERTLIYEAPPYKITYSIDTKSTKFISRFIFDDNCSSAYAQSIKDWANCNENPSLILAKKTTGFFDVIPIPIPITSELRKSWATDDIFFINGKRIFMHFFDWAVENYLERLIKMGITVSEEHKVAIGIPLNNAVTLYEYYESNSHEAKGLLKELLTPNHFKTKDIDISLTGMWLQHYKSSIIGPSNTPLGKLIENAFK